MIPPPALGTVTITDLTTNNVVASKPAGSRGSCAITTGSISQGVTTGRECISAKGGGGSVSFIPQRGESYLIKVSDPSKSWTVEIPEIGNASFNWSCTLDDFPARPSFSFASGGKFKTVEAFNPSRICNFP